MKQVCTMVANGNQGKHGIGPFSPADIFTREWVNDVRPIQTAERLIDDEVHGMERPQKCTCIFSYNAPQALDVLAILYERRLNRSENKDY